MKTFAILLAALAIAACNDSAPRPVANANTTMADQTSSRPETVIAHSTENKSAPISNTGKTKWTQSGEPIDTKEFDTEIAGAEKTLKSKPNDAEAKTAVGDAYYKRAVALTEARQYASALGD